MSDVMSDTRLTTVPPWVYIHDAEPPAGRAPWLHIAARFARRMRLVSIRRRHRYRPARDG
jgi:hypothetical protein